MTGFGEDFEFSSERFRECLQDRLPLFVTYWRRPYPTNAQQGFAPADGRRSIRALYLYATPSADHSGEHLISEFQGGTRMETGKK